MAALVLNWIERTSRYQSVTIFIKVATLAPISITLILNIFKAFYYRNDHMLFQRRTGLLKFYNVRAIYSKLVVLLFFKVIWYTNGYFFGISTKFCLEKWSYFFSMTSYRTFWRVKCSVFEILPKSHNWN